MAKAIAARSKWSGKNGADVYSVVGGIQIIRSRAERVANPSTAGQVNQRARLKLMSQLAAAIAPIIAYPRIGLSSPRNQFIKANMPFAYVANGEAQITLENIQLTNGTAGLPQVQISREANVGTTVQLAESADASMAAIVYSVYKKTSESYLQLIGSTVQRVSGANGDFPTVFPYAEGELIVWAYGLKAITPAASAKYANLKFNTGVDVANLVGTRTIDPAEFQFTQTRGTLLAVGENESVPVPAGYARVYVTPLGNGTVAGGGQFQIGSNVTVTATPNEGVRFLGWKLNGSASYISTAASYTFALAQQTDLVAIFETPEPGAGDEG